MKNPGSNHHPSFDEITARADAMQAAVDYADYAGWLSYLATDIRQCLAEPLSPELTAHATQRAVDLSQWMNRIEKNPQALANLRGVQEWAYLSKVDGTGQPFTLIIPEDYLPHQSYPLDVDLHGASGSHISTPEVVFSGFKLIVMGRNPFGKYHGLSEVDVLEAMEYVRSHWNIDPDRVHITGCSMGGLGTFSIASRFPDLFASARLWCGTGMHSPVENLLHVPILSIHSQDDDNVSIGGSRAAIRRVNEFGGTGIQYETNGYGHSVGAWKEGRDFAASWPSRHRRASEVRRIHYVAIDELARKAYWAEVLEWGPKGSPATIDARLNPDNTLYLTLENVSVARFDLSASPANPQTPMRVVVDGEVAGELAAPLPRELYVVRGKERWDLSAMPPEPPVARRHFPGGAMALFHGEPLMVVWGTQGSGDLTSRIFAVAQLARKASSPQWGKVAPYRPIGPAFCNLAHNTLIGQLPGKPDTRVTQADMEKYNLLLIGTAAQNSVVARLADRLPIKIEGSRVRSDDGVSWDFKNRAAGLLYYNPDAPQRLIYWAASESPEFYHANSRPMEWQFWRSASPDFLLMDLQGSLDPVAARCFDSRWNWEAGYLDSPFIPEGFYSREGAMNMAAEAMIRANGLDFVLGWQDPGKTNTTTLPASSMTRRMDVIASTYDARILTIVLKGSEILAALAFLEKAEEEQRAKREKGERTSLLFRFVPSPDPRSIVPAHEYLVGAGTIDAYVSAMGIIPSNLELSRYTVREAYERFLPLDTTSSAQRRGGR